MHAGRQRNESFFFPFKLKRENKKRGKFWGEGKEKKKTLSIEGGYVSN